MRPPETQSINQLALAAMTRIPEEESREECCDRLGLDGLEMAEYAVQTYNAHARSYGAKGANPKLAVIDVLLAGILLGLEMER